jgi:hypothetical protein
MMDELASGCTSSEMLCHEPDFSHILNIRHTVSYIIVTLTQLKWLSSIILQNSAYGSRYAVTFYQLQRLLSVKPDGNVCSSILDISQIFYNTE